MAELLNKRIPGLDPSSGITLGMLLAVYNPTNDKTEKISVSEFTTSVSTQNFEWLTDTAYNEDDVVTRSGKWWQAQQAVSANIAPGTDVAYWAEISKSPSGFVFWQAGVFTEDEVFVLYEIAGITYIFRLDNATRPFVSTDFEDEFASGDWEAIGGITVGGGGSISFVDRETPTGAVNGSNDTFVLSDTPQAGSEYVFLNGILQTVTDDYTITGDTIEFVTPPETGDKVRVSFRLTASADFVDKETPTGLINGSNDTFVLSDTPIAGSDHIYLNGILQDSADDYTIAGDTVTFATPPETGDTLKASFRI